jgi:hypothetical protein
MPLTLPLQKMSVEEKIQLMEALWNDLCGTPDSALTPDWHGKVLTSREALFCAGGDEFVDWESAKTRISKDLQRQ